MIAKIFLQAILLHGLSIVLLGNPSLLGTHFYVNQEKVIVDNTLKTVTTLARPYDLVAFIRQSERLARVELLQSFIDAVDDVDETIDQQQSSTKASITFDPDMVDSDENCQDFLRDGESLIFKILKSHLYDNFEIPLELKNISQPIDHDDKQSTIISCHDVCHMTTNLRTFDHLPSIAGRYEEQQVVHIDDEDLSKLNAIRNDAQAQWSSKELLKNRTSWLAYLLLSRYYYSKGDYDESVDCLRCAIDVGSIHEDIVLVDLANIVFRYGYLRDSIILIERALDYHLRLKTNNINSHFIRAILHYYLGHLCTIDNRFLLAIQFYNRTSILLERIKKTNDEQQLMTFSSKFLGSLGLPTLSSLSRKKIDALQCHLVLEASLQQKHHVLQIKLAQLSQLRAITDELNHLNMLIKHDMSHGHSMIDHIRQLKQEKVQMICDWASKRNINVFSSSAKKSVCQRETYQWIVDNLQKCQIEENDRTSSLYTDKDGLDEFSCYPREDLIDFLSESQLKQRPEENVEKRNSISFRRKTIEQSQSSYKLDEFQHRYETYQNSEQITLTSTTTWPTLTSRLPTNVIPKTSKDFYLKHSEQLYPNLNNKNAIKPIDYQLPNLNECQIHYFGLPSVGDYPTVWLPLENKGLLNIKQAFYGGLNHPNKNYPLPWSPPLCTLDRPINEHMSIIESHPVLSRVSRQRAPTNRYDRNMLLNLYFYIDTTIDEQLPIEEFGQRLRSVALKHRHLLPEWIVYILSSLYWRVSGHLPHAMDCGLKAHETIVKINEYKKWSDVTLINLANILYLWGKYEDALDLTQQAYRVNSHEPITNYFLGSLLALTKNNHTAAQQYYRRTLAIDPTNIYARRQLRLSYCFTMHASWEALGCPSDEKACQQMNIRSISMHCNSLSFDKQHQHCEATIEIITDNSWAYSDSLPCQEQFPGDRVSIDRWLNRTSITATTKHEELMIQAQKNYRTYGLCTSSPFSNGNIFQADECSQAFLATAQGDDIGHIMIVYDSSKLSFEYTIVFTNDYEHLFQRDNQMKCLIYGTGRKSMNCRNFNIIDLNEHNPKHNMTWWRDPSMLYQHLREIIEIMNYEDLQKNRSNINQYDLYQTYFTDQYLLSKTIQDKYILRNSISFNKNDCQNKSSLAYSPFLPTWISPQTKNIPFNSSVFKGLKKLTKTNHEPVCSPTNSKQPNNTKNSQLLAYILNRVKENLTLYRAETILKPVLLNLLFDKVSNKEIDEKYNIGALLASGFQSPAFNTSWLFYHTVSLYWRSVGNASQALNCLLQSHMYAPGDVQDLNYLSMALILYNSQLHINEAIYLLYESLSVDRYALMLSHFTLANAMARKGELKFAEQWYQSTLKLKNDFEPAKQKLRTLQC